MPDLLKIAVILVFILFLLRKKVPIGYVMLLSSTIIALLYRMDLEKIGLASTRAFASSISIKLLLALSLIRIFELVLREQNILSSMMDMVRNSRISRKVVIISMPLLIGMLPSLGGAYFSAPMVREATENTVMSSEEKAFINYWFRHPWEYILPLYPGVVFASAVMSVPLSSLVMANTLSAAAMLATGFIFSMKHVNSSQKAKLQNSTKQGTRPWLSFLPLSVVLVLVLGLQIELHYSLIAVLIPLFLFYRYGIMDIVRAVQYGFSWDVVVMIAGIVLFKETLEVSGAVANLSRFFLQNDIPALPVFCLLPLIAGLLTGHTVGFVGSTFPLLLSLSGQVSLPLVSLAFVSGLVGVLLSPVHLCLILTREYFSAELSGIYRRTIPAGAIVFGVAAARYFIVR